MALRVNRFSSASPVQRPSRLLAALAAGCVFSLAAGMVVASPPASAEQWKAGECEADVDDGGEAIQVCDDGFNLGVFWNDGSFVNGSCSDDGAYDVDYKGMSESDAIAWVKEFCGD